MKANKIDRAKFKSSTTTTEVLEGIDLRGRTVLITGGSSGLGAETARALASKGAQVTITARNLEKAQDVVSKIESETGSRVTVEEMELGSLASVRALAERFLSRVEKLDLLINNAGIMACDQSKTVDGFEKQFGVNHLGHFLLTCLLTPALMKGEAPRIVSLSSVGHQTSPVIFNDIQFLNREYDRWVSYGQAKTANALFAVGLEKRLAPHGIHAYAVHPGVIMTDLSRHLPQEEVEGFSKMVESGAMVLKSVEAGAATSVYAATAPELEGKGGVYLANCGVCPQDDESESQTVVRSYAMDEEGAEKLWRVSEQLLGQTFSF